MANVLDGDIEVSEFELQSCNDVQFKTYIYELLWIREYYDYPSERVAFVLSNLRLPLNNETETESETYIYIYIYIYIYKTYVWLWVCVSEFMCLYASGHTVIVRKLISQIIWREFASPWVAKQMNFDLFIWYLQTIRLQIIYI